jgi:hypothetical protein
VAIDASTLDSESFKKDSKPRANHRGRALSFALMMLLMCLCTRLQTKQLLEAV